MYNEESLENLAEQINQELKSFTPELFSSRSTTKYDELAKLLSKVLDFNAEEIYVCTVDRAANANTRFQQMNIRSQIDWKVFVGICTGGDTKSVSFRNAALKGIDNRQLDSFEGCLWISEIPKSDGTSFWTVSTSHVDSTTKLKENILKCWPEANVESLVPTAKTIPNILQNETIGFENLAESTNLDSALIDEILVSLNDQSPQVVLMGPPGTSKTHLAMHLGAYVVGDPGNVTTPKMKVIQFHPAFSYEDFVEGLRPIEGKSGTFSFEMVPGALVSLVEEMLEDGQPRVLVIDEMNRANLPAVFGELLFLLEYRNREISLVGREGFSLPENLYIIGTMNTADRSIRSVDAALRRRFDFFELRPSPDVLVGFYSSGNRVNELGQLLVDGFIKLNEKLETELGRHFTIGHTFFMRDLMTYDALKLIWKRQIVPLIEEYFFDQTDIASNFNFADFWPDGK